MSNIYRIILLWVLAGLVISCAAPVTDKPPQLILPEIKIVRHPEPVDYRWSNLYTELPAFDPNSTNLWQVDLRSSDLTRLDLSKSKTDLLYADFDSKTQWPEPGKMPFDFDWQKIMEIGKDPGLGIRALHDQGITGKGVGIAVVDSTLLVDHLEYTDRIRVYEETEDITGSALGVEFHGPAVASIAVGKTTGVAPKADLYYIATGDCGGAISIEDFDFSCRAKAIQRIVEINKDLPANRKIRVLSLSFSWNPQSKGYYEITAAVNKAKAAGIFVINVGLKQTYGWRFNGLGRDSRVDPNNFQSYKPPLLWNQQFFQESFPPNILFVPVDSRTTASPTGMEDYVFYRQGGLSWAVPYLAGMYALALQVKPDITPKEFWKIALRTGKTIQIQHAGKDYDFGVILDPQALIEAIKRK